MLTLLACDAQDGLLHRMVSQAMRKSGTFLLYPQ
jgi:hypothetical protein